MWQCLVFLVLVHAGLAFLPCSRMCSYFCYQWEQLVKQGVNPPPSASLCGKCVYHREVLQGWESPGSSSPCILLYRRHVMVSVIMASRLLSHPDWLTFHMNLAPRFVEAASPGQQGQRAWARAAVCQRTPGQAPGWPSDEQRLAKRVWGGGVGEVYGRSPWRRHISAADSSCCSTQENWS